MYVILSLLIGLLSAGCGVAYKIGSMGKVYPIQCATVLSFFGAIVFAMLGYGEWQYLSIDVILAGIIFGVTQYLGIRLLRAALQWGPLSPVWCAQSLNFVPVIFYSFFCLNEPVSVWQWGAVAATAGAIFAAANNVQGGKQSENLKHKLMYGFLLISVLVFISVMNVGLKYCSNIFEAGAETPVTVRSGNMLMFFCYIALGGSSAIDLTLSKSWRINKYAFIGGGMLSVCAILAFMITIAIVAKAPAVTLFAVSNATSILGAGLISVFFMKEKRTTAWYFTEAFALIAILLNH